MATAAKSVAPNYLVGGKYRLVKRVAEGGMGAVWRARHEVLDVDVAVKLMSTEVIGKELALARFEREAKASAQLKSQHIVRVHDYGVDGEMPFMVMELLEGEDLGERLWKEGPLSLETFAPIFAQICKGLEVAHDAGFVHRDMKPSNVFLAREGNDEIVKLVDFGVARETKTQIVDDKTSSGVVVGSPHHMSPEQAQGEAVDHRSDLWSLGVLAYRALTKQKPFKGEIMTAILLSVVSQPIPKPSAVVPELPPDVDRFIAHALTRNVDGRFQSATAMSDALTAIAEGRDVTPFLRTADDDEADEEGRDDATVPSGARISVPAGQVQSDQISTDRAPVERTASREVGAVTAGVIEASGVGKRRRLWPWLGLTAVLGFGAVVLGRTVATDAPVVAPAVQPAGAPAMPSTTSSSAGGQHAPSPKIADSVRDVVPRLGQSGDPPPYGSTPKPTNTPPPPRVQPPRVQPPRFQPPVKPTTRPRPKPQIDPFTGLPIKP